MRYSENFGRITAAPFHLKPCVWIIEWSKLALNHMHVYLTTSLGQRINTRSFLTTTAFLKLELNCIATLHIVEGQSVCVFQEHSLKHQLLFWTWDGCLILNLGLQVSNLNQSNANSARFESLTVDLMSTETLKVWPSKFHSVDTGAVTIKLIGPLICSIQTSSGSKLSSNRARFAAGSLNPLNCWSKRKRRLGIKFKHLP